jgi:hypothetical protein
LNAKEERKDMSDPSNPDENFDRIEQAMRVPGFANLKNRTVVLDFEGDGIEVKRELYLSYEEVDLYLKLLLHNALKAGRNIAGNGTPEPAISEPAQDELDKLTDEALNRHLKELAGKIPGLEKMNAGDVVLHPDGDGFTVKREMRLSFLEGASIFALCSQMREAARGFRYLRDITSNG